MDEAAAAAKQDPVAFRAALLQKHPRHLKVLQKAAELADWGKPLAPGAAGEKRARGVALHQSFGSIVAQVVEISTAGNRLQVHRVTCAIDCGQAINPETIAQQMEGSVVFALSAALFGGVSIEDGTVKGDNFHAHRLVQMVQSPEVRTHIVPSVRPPQGVGEPGVPPLAPALANAVAALTGQRWRRLPLREFS